LALAVAALVPAVTVWFGSLPRTAMAIQITEIMYHPSGEVGVGGDDGVSPLEWIEIYNESATPYDISEHYFSDGIGFAFPVGTILRGRTYIVVSADVTAFRAKYPEVTNVIGDFRGRLDNGGERVTLVNATGSPLASVRYNDGGNWPVGPDGAGYTVALRRPLLDVSKTSNWTQSDLPGGTPGSENFAPPRPVDTPLFEPIGPTSRFRLAKGWNDVSETIVEFSDPPQAWLSPDFDDSIWADVPGPVGVGEDLFATTLDDMVDRYLAFAVRRTFDVSAEIHAEMDSLRLTIARDDGFVAWINGVEIARDGLPGDPGALVPADARASRSSDMSRTPLEVVVPKDLVREGRNVLCVQVHNINLGSSDCGISVGAAYRKFVSLSRPELPWLRINEVSTSLGDASFVELWYGGEGEFDASGLYLSTEGLSTDGPLPARWALPAGSILSEANPRRVFATRDLPFDLASRPVRLFLSTDSAEDGVHLIDGLRLDPLPAEPGVAWSTARSPDGWGEVWTSVEPTPGEANSVPLENRVVMNEIHYHPMVREDELEFLELHNRGTEAVGLDGYSLASGYDFAFPAGTVIPAGGYLVVAPRPAAIREAYGLDASVPVLGPSENASPEELELFGRLSNSGESVTLRDPLGNTVDRVRYEQGGAWPSLGDAGGSSIELIDPRQDNSSPHAWAATDESARSEWTEYVIEGTFRALPPAQMESEIQIYAIEQGEFLLDDVSIVEQANPERETCSNGGFENDTRPWRITGTHIDSRRTTADAKSGAASLHVIASGAGDQKVNHIELDTTPGLRTGQAVRVRLSARWLRGANLVHVMLYNNVLGTTIELPVPATVGTPGRENSVTALLRADTGSTRLGPVIDSVLHSPAVPTPGTPTVVRARVSAADGLAKVEALWRRDRERISDPVAPWERVEMRDDGRSGDGEAGDGLFAGQIPPGVAKARYQFIVEATDGLGTSRSYPDATVPLLYIVDEFFPPDERRASLLKYRLVVDTEANQELTTRLLHSDDTVRGTMIFEEDQVFYNVGLRYRGSPWNRPPTPRMFRVRIPDDNPLLGRQRRVNLSRYGNRQNEGVGYQLIRGMSRPWSPAPHTPHYEYITISYNGRDHTPSHPMAEIQPVDTEYLRFWFPSDSDGWSYKVTGKLAFDDGGGQKSGSPDWTRFRWYGESVEDVRFYFNQNTGDGDNLAPVVDFMRVFDTRQTTNEEFLSKALSVMNLESSLRVFVVRDLIGDWDTVGIGNGQNAYIYFAPLEGRMYLLPWDMDHAFEQAGQQMLSGADPGMSRIFRDPYGRRIYAQIMKEGLDGAFRAASIDPFIDQVNEVAGRAGTQNGAGLKTFLNTRRSTAMNLIRQALNVPFALIGPQPVPAIGGSARIEGTAPLEAASYLVAIGDGEFEPVTPSWRAESNRAGQIATIWQIPITGLTKASETVQILAFTSGGDIIGDLEVRILETSGWAAPSVTTVEPGLGAPEGGTAVTIQGTGFQPGATVKFGTALGTSVVVENSETIRCVSPSGTDGTTVEILVSNIDGQSGALPSAFGFGRGQARFLRGDFDRDGSRTLTDAIATLDFLFRETGVVPGCADAADSDDNGSINISDAIRTLRFLFQGGEPLPEPSDTAGIDPTEDGLDCEIGI
jgi:hypothetical protein